MVHGQPFYYNLTTTPIEKAPLPATRGHTEKIYDFVSLTNIHQNPSYVNGIIMSAAMLDLPIGSSLDLKI